MLTGVVEVGLFCDMAKAAYFGNEVRRKVPCISGLLINIVISRMGAYRSDRRMERLRRFRRIEPRNSALLFGVFLPSHQTFRCIYEVNHGYFETCPRASYSSSPACRRIYSEMMSTPRYHDRSRPPIHSGEGKISN